MDATNAPPAPVTIESVMLKIQEQQIKIDQIYKSVEKTRRYFLWTFIITVAMIVLPMIGIAFVAPSLMGAMSGSSFGL
jgi:hypothetical protein